jgi:SAM-dependent methyltransferase
VIGRVGHDGAMDQEQVNATYDVLASRFDDWSLRVVPPLREVWAEKVGAYVAPGERVVELGCGTGEPVGRLLSERYEYEGVDGSPGMLAQARTAVGNGHFTEADFLAVDYPVGSLGAVVSFYAISHVPRAEHARLFTAIGSWLRPGGVVVANLTSRDDIGSVDPSWLDAGPMRWSGFDEQTNRYLLADAGFEILEAETIRQLEPDGCEIKQWWFVARRTLQ